MDIWLFVFLVIVILSIILIKLNRRYNSQDIIGGEIVIKRGLNGKKTFVLELDYSPEEIQQADKVIFKVVNQMDDDDPEIAS